jgi:hypothetical protein
MDNKVAAFAYTTRPRFVQPNYPNGQGGYHPKRSPRIVPQNRHIPLA